ncbi:hypothetical protein KIPB_000136 [Kipferlia bialata]|uniref:Uncharacterized protein n=1 Tax=Kipferlia bialata TaxID=797122 RepID=A0A9K3CLL7_9EUKA|nr:hypothetical protein KIPB_000136 [Kipferlia bialata]|eukprot:g136.t1
MTFTCPTDSLDPYPVSTDYICPVNSEGGYPYSWLEMEEVSDYPVSEEADIKMSLLRRLWFSSFRDQDGDVTVYSVIHAIAGPLACGVVLYLLVTLVRDPRGLRTVEATRAYREDYRLTQDPTPEVLAKWDKQDRKYRKRVALLKALDQTKVLRVSVPSLRTKLHYSAEEGEMHYATEGERENTDSDNYEDVQEMGQVVGGQVTMVFLLIGALLLVLLLELFLATPTPYLPQALYTPLPSYDINERKVESVPYTSLDDTVARVLADWTAAHDNLYVVEVVGGDWGTSCIDYSIVEDMYMSDRLKVIFGASAGIMPLGAQATPPTPLSALRDSGSLQLKSEGCTIKGSGMPCEALYTKDWFNPLDQPLVAYGCYVDDQAVYHHLTLVSTAMSTALPVGENPVYSVSWVPSEQFPLMGLSSPAVLKFLDSENPAVIYPTVPRFFSREYITCGLYGTIQNRLGDGVFSQAELDGTFAECLQYPSQVKWSLFGPYNDGRNSWDTSRITSVAASPLPVVDNDAEDLDYGANVAAGCVLSCTDGDCIYVGLMCEALQRGDDLSPSNLPKETQRVTTERFRTAPFQQPDGVLCPSQVFDVSTQRGTAQTASGAMSLFGVYTFSDHFGTLYNNVSTELRVCEGSSVPTASDPLSVTIRRTTEQSVTTVEFGIPSTTEGILSALALVGALFASHAVTLMVIETVHEKAANIKKKPKASTPVEERSEASATDEEGLTTSLLHGRQ